MLKFGILDFDTSHAVEFTKRLNHIGTEKDKDQWVDGGKVVIGCPGESKLSPERIPGFTEQMKKFEVPLVDKPTDMIGKVDVMLIEAVDGSVHYERAKPFLEAGIPCFVDKPFACSRRRRTEDRRSGRQEEAAAVLVVVAALRPELVDYMKDEKRGKVWARSSGARRRCTSATRGLFHYGIHAVEVLYTLMGPGCESVTCTSDKDVDVVDGTLEGRPRRDRARHAQRPERVRGDRVRRRVRPAGRRSAPSTSIANYSRRSSRPTRPASRRSTWR